MKYYTSEVGGVFKIHIGNPATGDLTTIYQWGTTTSYCVQPSKHSLDLVPGEVKNGYEVMVSFLTEVSRTEIMTVLEAAKSFMNTF
jgi:hypothetical protein